MIFCRLIAAVLKGNEPKCSFGLKDIPYIGYVITREGIKPDPKKVQGIMDTRRPSTTTEVQVMGYYNIRLSPTSQDMTTIVTEFGKFSYNHLHTRTQSPSTWS